jgi:cytochrome b involved in lipid metabolism
VFIDIYDLEKEHPGGEAILNEYAARDATERFSRIGHSNAAKKRMYQYIIGVLEGLGDTELKELLPK